VTLRELLVFILLFAIVCISDDIKVATCKDNTIIVDRSSVCIQASPTVDGQRCKLKQQNTYYKFCYTFTFASVVSGTVSCILIYNGFLSFFLHFPNVNVTYLQNLGKVMTMYIFQHLSEHLTEVQIEL